MDLKFFRQACGSLLQKRLPLIAGVLGTFLSVSPTAARAADVDQVRVVRVPDAGIQPQVQPDAEGRVHLIYFKGDSKAGDVFYVRSDDGGATFTKPLRVNSQPRSAIAIGAIRGPRLAVGKAGRAHVAWMGSETAAPKVRGKSAPMLYSRLNDTGDAFEPQRNVIQRYPGLDGGGAVAADADGNVYVGWHAPEKGDAEADRQVWITRSSDDGKTFALETAAAPPGVGTCGCCGMTMAAGPNGRVYVLFRSAREMVNRDMYLLASTDGGKTFKVARTDPWQIGSCVMSTSHFAAVGSGEAVGVWETQNQIRIGRATPDGAKASEPVSVPGKGGGRKHPAVAVNRQGEFVVAWAEDTRWNRGGSVAWQVFDREGRPVDGKLGRADGLLAWNVPAAFAAPDGSFRVAY